MPLRISETLDYSGIFNWNHIQYSIIESYTIIIKVMLKILYSKNIFIILRILFYMKIKILLKNFPIIDVNDSNSGVFLYIMIFIIIKINYLIIIMNVAKQFRVNKLYYINLIIINNINYLIINIYGILSNLNLYLLIKRIVNNIYGEI